VICGRLLPARVLKTSVLPDILITMKNDRRNILYFPSFFPIFFISLLEYTAEVFHHNQLYETADETIQKGTGNSFYIIVSPKVSQSSNSFSYKSF
jgi:hypothetical protein